MDHYKNELASARVMLKARRRLDAQTKLEKLVNDLTPEKQVKDESLLLETLITLADLLDDMGYYIDSLSRRNEAIALAIKKFGIKSEIVIKQLISRAYTTWTLFDKQEERRLILKYAQETASSIGDAMKSLTMMVDYPNRDSIMEDLRPKLHCVLMVTQANSQIEKMMKDNLNKPVDNKNNVTTEDETMLDEPYSI